VGDSGTAEIIDDRRRRLARLGRHHGWPLLLYFVISLGLTWPLVRDFTTRTIGVNHADPRHSLWMLWHGLQWLEGRDGFTTSRLVYAPHGTSLLTDGVGPLSGIVSVPFWILGPAAAYNGVVFMGIWLTAYCMYVLARALGLGVTVAFFAGVVYQLTPIHLAGVFIHLEKTFIGFLPLTILVLLRALDPGRTLRWMLAVGLVTLAVALHSGYQLVYAAVSLVFWTLASVWMTAPANRRKMIGRATLTTLCVVACTAPILLAIARASQAVQVRVNVMSPYFAPDVVQLFLPSFYHRHYSLVRDHLDSWHIAPIAVGRPDAWAGPSWETAVTIPLTALVLSAIALWRMPRLTRPWAAFALVGLVLMLGPTLRIFGDTRFTPFGVPIIMPYAVLVSLPGLSFMRTPGRFGMMAWVGIAMVAAEGLRRLMQRWPRRANVLAVGATIIVLVEGWPVSWPQASLQQVPDFYRELARDRATYAVLDLPAAYASQPCDGCWAEVASIYQMYQIVHRKAIAWGYFSHTDAENLVSPLRALVSRHPFEAPELRVNGASPDVGAAIRAVLVRGGFRYIVWHKTILQQFGKAEDDRLTGRFISQIFGPGVLPMRDDAMVRVYALPPSPAVSTLTASVGDNWHTEGPGEMWATSPATIVAEVPRAMTVQLVVTPGAIHHPGAPGGMGQTGELHIGVEGRTLAAPISVGRPTTILLQLGPGSQTITLALAAGNFRAVDYGGADATVRSFSLRAIDLRD
jgi:hypothetical protein